MSEHEPRFGESFIVKKENRLDPLRENPEVPEYVVSSREVRTLLQEAAEDPENKGWDVMPENIQGVEDIFNQAKDLVTEKWNEKVHEYLAEKCRGWAKELQGKSEFSKQADLLNNPSVLEEKLRIRQFGVLEDLRKVLPEAWRELVLISSERQLAEIAVARRWITELPAERQQQIAEECGVKSTKELEIFVDAAAALGKYFNYAYVKQIELADAPGGSVKTPLAETSTSKGIKYLYDLAPKNEGEEVDIKPYAKVFPFEWGKIAKSLERLAQKVEQAQKDNKVGKEYEKLPAYLREMITVYNSDSLDPDTLYKEWSQLLLHSKELAHDEGCPVMLLPQAALGVAGDARKVEVEVRLGFITESSRELAQKLNQFVPLVEEMLAEQRPFLAKDHKVPPTIVNYQVAFGPNTNWTSRGGRTSERIAAHTNAVLEVAETTALPAFESVFDRRFDNATFKKATLLDNGLHELGHTLAPIDDENVRKNIGSSSEADTAEELKADTANMKILQQMIERGKEHIVNISEQVEAKLADVCDYLKNKSSGGGTSGGPYYYDGVAIISRLLDRGIVVEKANGKYGISDDTKAVDTMAEINDELTELYLKGTPEKLKEYIDLIKVKKDDTQVKKFLDKLFGR